MKKHSSLKRILAVCLSLVMVLSLIPGSARAAGSNRSSVSFEKIDPSEVSVDLRGSGFRPEKVDVDSENTFKSTDRVRVMIVLPGEAAISLVDEGTNASDPTVEAYRENLRLTQEYAAEVISEEALDGEELDVVWNLTLAVNAISANVEYGQIEDIANVNGVQAVYLERRYEPMSTVEADLNNIPAQNTTGAAALKVDGYTGAGMRIAVIDTGTARFHQSFDAGAFEYSLEQQAKEKGMTLDEYKATLNLLTEEEIGRKMSQLNAGKSQYYDETDAYLLYKSSKLPFGYNYIDANINIDHVAGYDESGNYTYEEHGSHVAGIAAANSYVPDGNGGYTDAAEAVGVTGVAPDAQIITMKVFGANGGAYTSDNFAAIEDAMVLDCDVVNLSLGSSGGFVTARGEYRVVEGDTEHYGENETDRIDAWVDGIMDDITDHGIIMCVSAGNAGNWAEGDNYVGVIEPPFDETTVGYGMMYTDEGGTYNVGSPSTFHNTMSVASADNVGNIAQSMTTISNGTESENFKITSTVSEKNPDWSVLDENDGDGTEYEIVFLGDPSSWFETGEAEDDTIYGGYDENDNPIGSKEDLTGKIVMISRGNGISFLDKRAAADELGAVAVICYNNVQNNGAVSPDLSTSTSEIPFGSVSYEDGKAIFDLCEKNADGLYACKATIYSGIFIDLGEEGAKPGMSYFSSWGTTGALTIKPEITAPGGSIYSVNGGKGQTGDTGEYENMSGTSMAAPHFSGLVALTQQYIRNEGILAKARTAAGAALTERQLAQSLLMSTADPLVEYTDRYGNAIPYSVRNQGAGLANVQKATSAKSFILVDTDGKQDGKVKAELGDGTTPWTFTFTIYNLTNAAQRYVLSADMMTTGTTTDGYDWYSTNNMTALAADVAFSTGDTVTVPAKGSAAVTATVTVSQAAVSQMRRLGYTNGFYVEGYVYATSTDIVRYDLSGDRTVNVADAQALMNHVIKGSDLANAGLMDLDSDGELTTRDVSLFLDLLQYDLGTVHSIPMLGWYGNWTDISMFDGYSLLDYLNKDLEIDRLPHVFNFYGSPVVRNILLVSIDGTVPADSSDEDYSSYWYMGNMYEGGISNELRWGDEWYIPARNAINNDGTGWWQPAVFSPFLMRNAIAARVQVVNSDDPDTVYYTEEYLEPFEGAYYNSRYGILMETTDYTLTPIGEKEDGSSPFAGIPEDTDITLSFSYAPEYYENADGSIRWNDLGDGATISFPFRIDNTAPTLLDTFTSGSKLIVMAEDNNYIAYMAVLDGSGSAFADLPVCPDMDEDQRGELTVQTFDISGLDGGNKAVIALCDYAGNESFYSVNLSSSEYPGGGYGDLVAFQTGYSFYAGAYQQWVSFDADVDENETPLFNSDSEFYSADYANGIVYAQDAQGWLYGIRYEDMVNGATSFASARIKRLSNAYQDMAYNYSDGMLYGVRFDDSGTGAGTSYLDKIDLGDNCAVTPVTSLPGIAALGLACDDDGTLYLMGIEDVPDADEDAPATLEDSAGTEEVTAKLYVKAAGAGSFTVLFDTGKPMNYLQSMTWDHNSEKLYWARCAEGSYFPDADLWEIDVAAKTCTQTGALSGETRAMFAPLTDANAEKAAHATVPSTPANANGAPVLANAALNLAVGGSRQLTYDVTPWYADNVTMAWNSSDTDVATVSQNGLVTAVSTGTAIITVKNTADESLTDTCTVNVVNPDVTINGTYSVMGNNIGQVSGSSLYTFTMDDGMTPGPRIAETAEDAMGTQIGAAVLVKTSPWDQVLWACEWGNMGLIRKINDYTGWGMDIVEFDYDAIIQPIGGEVTWGLTYSPETEYFAGIANNSLRIDLPSFDTFPGVNIPWIPDKYDEPLDDDGTTLEDLWVSEEQFDFWHEMLYDYYVYDPDNHINHNYWHELDFSPDLIASDEGFGTNEAGNGAITDVVLCGITDIGSAGAVTLTGDYLGGSTVTGSYTPDTTLVLLDNVGRLWYVDELMGMTKAKDSDTYTDEDGNTVSGTTGIHTWKYADDNYSVFVIREIVETPLTEMYWQDTMPRYSYHFSDMYYAGLDNNDNEVYLLSLYDYHNSGTTNHLYLLIMDGDGTLIELGDTGENNVVATIYDAVVDMDTLPGAGDDAGDNGGGEDQGDDVLRLAFGPYTYTR